MPGEKILVVEDNPELLSFLGGNVLPYHGYQVVTATSGQEGLSKLLTQEPDLLLLDMQLPDVSGIDILKTMPRDVGHTPVILMTAFGSESIAVEAFRLGVKDYIIKPFTSEEVVNAIERALTETRLRKEKEQLTQSLRQRVQELMILSAVGKSVVSLMDLEELLNRIVEAGVQVTKAEEGFLLLVDRDTKDLCLRAGKNLGELQARGFRLKVADTLAGQVVKTGKPVRCGAGETGRDFKLKTGYLVKSLLHVPLVLGERAIGVLSVDNQVSDREFSEGDQHLLCTLADYAAVSIENATLYSELRKSIDELKCSQQGLIQSSKLAALGRLTASLAHEINNPLQAIRSCISILANRSLDQDKRETYLGIADKELARLAQLVDRMLDFHRPSMGSRGPTDVNALLDDTLTLVSKQLQHSDITLSKQLTPDLPPVEAAASYLRQVFINLVLNAAEAMPEGGTLVVSTGLDVENGQLVMVFTDTGVGIPADSLPYIFEPFYTTKSSGSGLGLSISYAIVEQQGGRMEVKSVEGEGATFTIRLPLNGERDA